LAIFIPLIILNNFIDKHKIIYIIFAIISLFLIILILMKCKKK
jgi:hypothetical protein